MILEAKKLKMIERFMKIQDRKSILELENKIEEIEMNLRADIAENEIENKSVHTYDDFSNSVKKWISNHPTN